MIKKRSGSPENIGDKIALLNPMNTFVFFPPLVLSSLLTHLTQRHLKKGKKKERVPLSFSVPCYPLVSAIPTSYIISNVKPLVEDLMRD